MLNEKRWDAEIQRMMRETGTVGLAVSVTDRERTVWQRGYGVTSIEKPWDAVTPRTLFRIASCTKMTLGVVVMRLCEQGLLSLDAPITDYVPWLRFRDGEASASITLRRLLSHTAGLPSEYTPDGTREEAEAEAILQRELMNAERIADPKDALFHYSNLGVRLAACAVERVLGLPFSEIDRRYVLGPLSMSHSTFDLNEAATRSLAIPHKSRDEVLHYIPVNAARHAVGGLFSNVEDMAKFARMLLNRGDPLITEASWRQMITPEADRFTEQRDSYGITMLLRRYRGVPIAGHTGSSPPYYACIWTAPEQGWAVSVTVNTEGGSRLTRGMIPDMLFDDLLTPYKVDASVPCSFSPEAEESQLGSYFGEAEGLIRLAAEDGRPVLHLNDGVYPLIPGVRKGVYTFRRNGIPIPVGLPAVRGGSRNHIEINSSLYRRVIQQPTPSFDRQKHLVGSYGTVLEHFTFVLSEDGLMLYRRGTEAGFPCTYVAGTSFTSALGGVTFTVLDGSVTGVRVGSSVVHRRV